MTNSSVRGIVLLLLSVMPPLAIAGDPQHSNWWRQELRDPYWESPCEYKVESKPGEYKREIKCKDGIGATWRGEWKEEFRDGGCEVKLKASREVFKEEVKCKG